MGERKGNRGIRTGPRDTQMGVEGNSKGAAGVQRILMC